MKLSKKILLGTGIGAAVAAAVPFIAGEIMWLGVLTKKGSDITSKIFGETPVPPEKPASYNILEGIEEWYENTPHTEILTVNPKNEIPCAELFEVQGSHKWAIICHGYTSGPSGMAHYAREYYNKGYNVILPYMRGNAKGIKAKNIVTYTMGYQDKYDLLGWIDYAVKADPDCQIVLHGESMGAATVMMTVGEPLPDNVKCAVEDCGYTSVWDEFSHQICIKRHVDLDFKDASSIEVLKSPKHLCCLYTARQMILSPLKWFTAITMRLTARRIFSQSPALTTRFPLQPTPKLISIRSGSLQVNT